MAKWQPQGNWRRWVYTPLTAGVLVLVLVFLTHSVWQNWNKYRLARQERQQVENDLASTHSRGQDLAADVALLQTEPGVEQLIREKFSVVQEGEKVIVVVDGEATDTPATKDDQAPWWQFWDN